MQRLSVLKLNSNTPMFLVVIHVLPRCVQNKDPKSLEYSGSLTKSFITLYLINQKNGHIDFRKVITMLKIVDPPLSKKMKLLKYSTNFHF